jgi:hypothetical protein
VIEAKIYSNQARDTQQHFEPLRRPSAFQPRQFQDNLLQCNFSKFSLAGVNEILLFWLSGMFPAQDIAAESNFMPIGSNVRDHEPEVDASSPGHFPAKPFRICCRPPKRSSYC